MEKEQNPNSEKKENKEQIVDDSEISTLNKDKKDEELKEKDPQELITELEDKLARTLTSFNKISPSIDISH